MNDAQQDVLNQLTPSKRRPKFKGRLRDQLADDLYRQLQNRLVGMVCSDRVFVSKHKLSSVHSCEARYLAEEGEKFEWSLPMVRGSVIHKAIELLMAWPGDPAPMDVVGEAINRLKQGDKSVTEFLNTCSEADIAELTGTVNSMFSDFVEGWPRLRPEWWPVAESRLRVELNGLPVVMSGRVDLTLGRSEGRTAGKVLVDFKTGGSNRNHIEDLRFYALLETMKYGTPPRMVASYYLDKARLDVEEVTVELLEAALARTVDGIGRMVELAVEPDTAIKRTSYGCTWCPILDDCAEGTDHLEQTTH